MTGEVITFAEVPAVVGGPTISRWSPSSGAERLRDDAWQQVCTDALTGLPNGIGLEVELQQRQDHDSAYTVGLIGLDAFTAVNDHCGHDSGDVLLAVVALRLMAGVGTGGFVARLHGDQFVVVLPRMTEEQMTAFAWRIRELLAEPGALPGHFLYMQWASVGMTAAAAGEDLDDVLRCAERAMRRAKRAEVGIAVFDDALDTVRPATPVVLPMVPPATAPLEAAA
jgi:diguanylate cyclase